MRVSFPLYAQILSVLLLNLLLLVALFLIFFESGFASGLDALIRGPVGDQIQAVGWAINKHIATMPQSGWNQVLSDYGKTYGVKFYIFGADGEQVAGDKISVPKEVQGRFIFKHTMHMGGPGMHFGFFRTSPDMMPPPPSGVMPDLPPTMMSPQRSGEIPNRSPDAMPPPRSGEMPNRSPDAMPPPRSGEMPDRSPDAMPPPRSGEMPDRSPVMMFPSPIGLMPDHPPGAVPAPPSGMMQTPPFPPVTFMIRTEGNGPKIGELDSLATGRPFMPPPPPNQQFLIHTKDPNSYWIGTFFPIVSPNMVRQGAVGFFPGPPMRPGVLIATTPNLLQSKLGVNLNFLYVVVLCVLGVSIVIWSPFAFRVTRTLGELTDVTQHIANGNFDVKLKDGNWDELKRLASSINVLSSRLNNFVLGQRRFLGDIAHELCSPISRLQIALALLEESRSERHPAIIRDIRDEVADMSALIQELLSFSKASLRGQQVELTPVAVAPLIRHTVEKIGSSASFLLDVDEKLFVLAEETLLQRAFANVLRNSVRYAAEYGPIDVVASAAGSQVTITVRDRGPGVPPEALDLLGEPFYRPEPSRDRNTGGAGLGLAIVKTCIETCQGTLLVENCAPHGLVVKLVLCQAAVHELDPAKEPTA